MGNSWMDFDSGTLNSRINSTKDLQLEVQSPQLRFLHPDAAPVAILKIGSTKPSYTTCSHAAVVNRDYRLSLAVGEWFCFKTDAGRLVRFRVDSKQAYPGGIHLTWTTWEL